MTYLVHVTLGTGHTCRSPRAEVGEGVLARLRPVLAEALGGGEPLLSPGTEPPCTLTASAEGRCLIATVWAPPEGSQRVPLVTIGVARHSRCGRRLWETLHAHATMPLRTRADDEQPGVPWCAARLEPGIAHHPHAARWLGDAERCVAWTWVQFQGTTRARG